MEIDPGESNETIIKNNPYIRDNYEYIYAVAFVNFVREQIKNGVRW